jgi:hypothetical protein
MSYQNEIITDVIKDIYKATKLLSDIDHNLAFTTTGNATNIIRSCEQILLCVAEDLYEKKTKEEQDEPKEPMP